MDAQTTLPPVLDTRYRASILHRAPKQRYDLLVIGGGINGAGIAYDAAMRGFNVLLVEKSDFASGTSSRSSKLIHGGIRYLKNMELGLVFEALRERSVLLKLCPQIVQPMQFLYPVYKGDPDPAWAVRLGLTLYDGLSMFRSPGLHDSLSVEDLERLEPGLSRKELQFCPRYYDARMNDARLVLATVQSAVRSGADVLNYMEVRSFLRDGDKLKGATMTDRLTGLDLSVEARLIVNAAGPWLDRVASFEGANASVHRLRPSKGVHILVPKERLDVRHAIVIHSPDDGRGLFVIPWERMNLIGTTDTFFDGSPDEVYAEKSDIDYLLRATNHVFPEAALQPKDVYSTYAGLRPLVGQMGKNSSETSREHETFLSPGGLLSIGGGKYTTFRAVAQEVVDKAAEYLRVHFGLVRRTRSYTDNFPFEGGAIQTLEHEAKDLELRMQKHADPDVALHLVRNFGSNARFVVDIGLEGKDRFAPLIDGLPYTLAEFLYSARYEAAGQLDDLMMRRTLLHLEDKDQGLSCAEKIAVAVAPTLAWERERIDQELQRYEDESRRTKNCLS